MRDTRAPASTETFLEVDGARLRLRDEGQGRALVLVHGWALDLEMWEPQAAAWSSQWRVLRYDRRGFGASTGQPSLATDARDLESLLRRLDLHEVVLLGMSQGARVAMQVAAGPLSGRIAGLVLDGAPWDAAGNGEPEVPIDRYRELARGQGIEAVRAEWRRHPFMQLATQDSAAHALLAGITARYPGADLRGRAVTDTAVPPDVATIAAPTLVVNGVLDTARRRAKGIALARALPHAMHALVLGAGHLPNLDNPAEYNRRVLAFVEQHCAGASPAG